MMRVTHLLVWCCLGLCLHACAQPEAPGLPTESEFFARMARATGDPGAGARRCTVAEARRAIEAECGVDLSSAKASTRSQSGRPLAEFVLRDGTHKRTFAYDLGRSLLRTWDVECPDPEHCPECAGGHLTESETLAAGREEARRHLGDLVDSMRWRCRDYGESWGAAVQGDLESWGDPPRALGSYPEVAVSFRANGGRAHHYHQVGDRPPSVMLAPQITSDEAVAIVAHAVRAESLDLKSGPTLWQHGNGVGWSMTFRDPSADHDSAAWDLSAAVDGTTGELIAIMPFGSRKDAGRAADHPPAGSARRDPACDERQRVPLLPLLGGLALHYVPRALVPLAVVGGIGVCIARIRRRR